jgi:L-aspartate oxidase
LTLSEALTARRYLLPFKASRLPQQFTDVLVIGGGVAGLRAAIAAADGGADVVLMTKDSVDESNTWYAQGGIAAVLQPLDSVESHIADTEVVGAGLCDPAAVKIVVEEAPARVLELLKWGANFDKKPGNAYDLAFGLEGGHSFARILHAYGDATGKELAQTLIRTVRSREQIRLSEHAFVIDLLTVEGKCLGAIAYVGGQPSGVGGQLAIIWAKRTILASGGAGQLFRESTNPRIATADGHAMAYRAGAVLQDMEMVQFHPTTLYVAGGSRALITEAVRGEGAYLIDKNGYRFMKDYHPDGELAPRDVVSRAIVSQVRKTNFTHVFLDVRHLPAVAFRERFPQFAKLLQEFELDAAKDPIPVHPAMHYIIGGVDADSLGRTSLSGLYAVGEASCSGLHGANRLASNSLLEGLVFGARAGADAAAAVNENVEFPKHLEHRVPPSQKTELDIVDVKSSLRSVMWRNVGIERSGERLSETREILSFWSRYVLDKTFDPAAIGTTAAIAGWEVQNMLTACYLITTAAHARTESRGTHFRLDYPVRDDAHWRLHLLWKRPSETPIPKPV